MLPPESQDEKRQGARRRGPREQKLARARTGDSVALNFMGRLYTKIVGFSVITRYLVYIAPVALILAIPLIVMPFIDDSNTNYTIGDHHPKKPDGTRDPDAEVEKGPLLYTLFIWIEASWLSLWAGKIVAHLLPPIFMFFCGVVSSGTRKYAAVLRALEVPLSLFFWALSSWLIFRGIFKDPVNKGNINWVNVVFSTLR